jgi:hypothetical protein
MKNIVEETSNDRSRFVGQGKWVNDSCYQVYEVDGKFYAIIVAGQVDMWMMDETLQEIKEEDIEKYVEKF